MSWMHGLRARLRLLSRRSAEQRMDDEIRFHLEMQTEQYLREGLSPREARRRAVLAFGGVEGHREAIRDGRTFGWAGGISLDLKLGFRMLRKYPGLTVVGGLAIAFAICVGAGTFELLTQIVYPKLPLPGGERIVAIQNWDAAASATRSPDLHDVSTWSRGLRTIEDVGAFRTVERNLSARGVAAQPVPVAEMTGSAFRVASVPAMLGRTLIEADHAPGAAPVVVLGHDLWRSRFGGAVHTVVGVMPEGFRFPVAHQLWTPLRVDPHGARPGEGTPVRVFGRLDAPGPRLRQRRAADVRPGGVAR